MTLAKKSLGQHWLKDSQALEAIAEAAEIKKTDTVLEIGPGQGSLTALLVRKAQKVIAVELDSNLAKNLSQHTSIISKEAPWKGELEVVEEDILKFDLAQLPAVYKVVANIPYYLTSNLLRVLSESTNPPRMMVLLVQKEVAERICARPGQMSLLAVSIQLYYDAGLGLVIPAKLFEPPPKVDSQVVILRRHVKPLFHDLDTQKFFKLVKAGFSERRKKLRSSLSGGLNISKEEADKLLQKAGISSSSRAQELSLEQWHNLYLKM